MINSRMLTTGRERTSRQAGPSLPPPFGMTTHANLRNPRCVSPCESRAAEVDHRTLISLIAQQYTRPPKLGISNEKPDFFLIWGKVMGQKISRFRPILSPESHSKVSSFTRSARTSSMVVTTDPRPADLGLVSSPSSRPPLPSLPLSPFRSSTQ